LTLRGENPEKIDRYEIIEPIGFGAMGAVYKAFDPIIKRPVAVKTIRLDIPPASPDYRAFLERFTTEARTAGRLSHPNIVTLYDVGHTEDKLPWLAMEYVAGKTVADLLQGEQLKAEVVIGLVSQIASAIDYAHSEGVVHRDIKPSNVIVYAGEKVKVTDFGIAKLMDADVTHSGLMMGTPSYMSPEQAMGEDLDGRTDIFSLGVVAFEMLSGQQPFPGNNVTSILYKLVHADPVRPDDLEVLGLLPDKWHEVFSRVLAKNPAERYPTAAAFVQELELCLGSWFGSLDGATVVMREPLLGDDSDRTLVVSGSPPQKDDTILAPREPELRSATLPVPDISSLSPDLPETVAMDIASEPAPALESERTLYAGSDADETVMGASDETVIAGPAPALPPPLPAEKPAMTVTIRKPSGLPRVLLPVLVGGALGLAAVAALVLWLSRDRGDVGSGTPVEAAPLVEIAGSIQVTTEPPGARVLVNGEERGTTPLVLEQLALGLYQVRIETGGFQPEELETELTSEAPLSTLNVSLRPEPKPQPAQPQPAFFRIRSNPPGAQVVIDGRELGVTPLDRVRVETGSRVVRIVLDGFVPWEDTFRARAGRTETIEAVLTSRGAPAPAPIEDEPEPAPAVVEGALVERGEPGVTNAKCVRCPGVPFPEQARRARMEGMVELDFLIDENGSVQDIRVVESSGPVFDSAVVETVRNWKYEPATKNGVRVKMRWIQRFRFQQGR
jgi:serine/threonine-protein kinase